MQKDLLILLCSLSLALSAISAEGTGGEGPAVSPQEKARIEKLCRELGHGDEGRRWDAARELASEGDKAVPSLSQILKGEWGEGKKMAAWVLGKIPTAISAAALAGGLSDTDKDVRWKAAVSLVQIGEVALPELRRQLRAEPVAARQCAAWAIGQLKDAGSAHFLARALGDKNDDVRWKAAVSLKEIGDDSLPALLKVIRSGSERARQSAVWAIGEIGTLAAQQAVDQLTRDPDPTVRAKAAVAASSIGGEAGLKLALFLVKDKDQLVRREAVLSLARLFKDKKSVPQPPEAGLNGVFEFEFAVDGDLVREGIGPEVVLVTPSLQERRAKSFQHAENLAKARFSPDEPGLWYYEAREPDKALPIAQGALRCLGRSDSKGVLQVRETPVPGLQFRDGTTYFPIGAGTVGLSSRNPEGGPANSIKGWERYLEDCGKSGINHLRLFLLEVPWVPQEEVARFPEFSPWILGQETQRYDLRSFQPAFWSKLDAVLHAALKARVVIELVLFDELGLDEGKGKRWALHPFNAKNGGPIESAPTGWPAFYDLTNQANREAQERYVSHLLTRTAAFPNVYYELNNEMGGGDLGEHGLKWLLHWIEFFEKHDPAARPLSLSALDFGRRYLSLAGIDVVNLHGDSPARLKGLTKPHMLSMPTVRSADEERWLLWRALFAGIPAAGRPWRPLNLGAEFFKATAGIARFVAELDGWAFRPKPSLLLAAPPGVGGTAGENGGIIWVYLYGSFRGQGAVRLGHPGNDSLRLTWVSTDTGEMIKEDTERPKDGMLVLRPPEFEKDVLLRIEPKATDALKSDD